jgi:hypothetical protein
MITIRKVTDHPLSHILPDTEFEHNASIADSSYSYPVFSRKLNECEKPTSTQLMLSIITSVFQRLLDFFYR